VGTEPREWDKLRITHMLNHGVGFVRVLSQAPHYGLTVAQSRSLLLRLKRQGEVPFEFITDSHLAELAQSHDSALATLDQRIPAAFIIPA
jgi:hypothetical protein